MNRLHCRGHERERAAQEACRAQVKLETQTRNSDPNKMGKHGSSVTFSPSRRVL